ncbi:hypothetical protein HPB47_022782 [Ixodes persulcatus]|uniref:Uncharacterized protein n=1 Tax=Ixodes persulcatus TaxID=34615 RepID=A0AC60Q9I7_IXOPE|nr:hypothetical protein HPB47_022782 [Ixodes persulcatus]
MTKQARTPRSVGEPEITSNSIFSEIQSTSLRARTDTPPKNRLSHARAPATQARITNAATAPRGPASVGVDETSSGTAQRSGTARDKGENPRPRARHLHCTASPSPSRPVGFSESQGASVHEAPWAEASGETRSRSLVLQLGSCRRCIALQRGPPVPPVLGRHPQTPQQAAAAARDNSRVAWQSEDFCPTIQRPFPVGYVAAPLVSCAIAAAATRAVPAGAVPHDLEIDAPGRNWQQKASAHYRRVCSESLVLSLAGQTERLVKKSWLLVPETFHQNMLSPQPSLQPKARDGRLCTSDAEVRFPVPCWPAFPRFGGPCVLPALRCSENGSDPEEARLYFPHE